MSCFLDTGAPVIGFCMNDDGVFLLCGSDLIKADRKTGAIQNRVASFGKDGKSRLIRANGTLIAVSDFCTLSVFRSDPPEKILERKLGIDLSSDICGLLVDETFIYACIRNGRLTRIRLSDFSQETFETGDASSWSLVSYGDTIIAGTVDGKLMQFEKESVKCVNRLQLSRQNIRSLSVDGDTLYAAGQDKKLYVIDLPTFGLVRKTPNIHRMMFDVIGVRDGILYTVSHPDCEISGWSGSGAKVYSLPYRLRLSGGSCIDGNAIYISSRNINGVEKIEL